MTRKNMFGGIDATTGENAYALMERAGLNFDVEARPLYADTGERAGEMSGIWRTDSNEYLGTVGSRYHPLQYSAHFDFLNSLTDELIVRESATIDNGARAYIYCWAKSKPVEIQPSDALYPALFFRSSHDGSWETVVDGLFARENSCKNLHALGFSRGVKHTKNQTLRINLIRADIRKALGLFDLMIPRLRALASCECSVDTLAEFVNFLFPPVDAAQKRAKTLRDNTVASIFANLNNANNNIGTMSGTMWAAYNALSEFVDHGARYNGTDDAKRDNRIKSIVIGRGAALKTKALNRLFEIAGV